MGVGGGAAAKGLPGTTIPSRRTRPAAAPQPLSISRTDVPSCSPSGRPRAGTCDSIGGLPRVSRGLRELCAGSTEVSGNGMRPRMNAGRRLRDDTKRCRCGTSARWASTLPLLRRSTGPSSHQRLQHGPSGAMEACENQPPLGQPLSWPPAPGQYAVDPSTDCLAWGGGAGRRQHSPGRPPGSFLGASASPFASAAPSDHWQRAAQLSPLELVQPPETPIRSCGSEWDFKRREKEDQSSSAKLHAVSVAAGRSPPAAAAVLEQASEAVAGALAYGWRPEDAAPQQAAFHGPPQPSPPMLHSASDVPQSSSSATAVRRQGLGARLKRLWRRTLGRAPAQQQSHGGALA